MPPPETTGVKETAEEVLDNAPCGFVSFLPDGSIIQLNKKLEEWTGRPRDELIARTRFEELLSKGEQILFETHLRPLLLLKGDVSEISCHIRRPEGPDLPVFMNCTAKRDSAGKPVLYRATLFDATQRQRYEDELRLRRRQSDHLAAIVKSSRDAMISLDLEQRIRTWNNGATALFGYLPDEAVGLPIDSLILPPAEASESEVIYETVARQGEMLLRETERLHKNGTTLPVELRASPITDDDGKVSGISVIFRDITERKLAEEQMKLVLRELNHRTKNLMGIVLAMVNLSGKQTDPDSFRRDISSRLAGLAKSQDLLVSGNWRSIDLQALVQGQVEHFCDHPSTQLHVKGKPVVLGAAMAQTLGMALHELSTNAVKHGALSSPEGTVGIMWEVGDKFRLSWSEANGPAVSSPNSTGFGTTVLTRMVEAATGGKVTLDYAATGFIWQLEAPVGIVELITDDGDPQATSI